MKKLLPFFLVLVMLLSCASAAMAEAPGSAAPANAEAAAGSAGSAADVSYSRGFGSLLDNLPQDSSELKTEPVPENPPDAETVLNEAAKEKTQTIMVYMCGTNLESDPQSSASKDIKEMIASGYNTKEVNLLLLAGGTRKWHITQIDGENTGIYTVRPDGITKVWDSETQLNMGDPETLKTLLTFGKEHFPAKSYGLVFWDHGGGAIGGVCHDEFTGDLLSMEEIRTAIAASPFGEKNLEWIGFDACLMGSAEASQLLSPYARYMVASEESEPGFGWSYSFLNGVEQDRSGADTGKRIIDSFMDWYRENYPSLDITLSCVDLSRIPALSEEINRFFAGAEGLFDSAQKEDFAKAAWSVKAFGNTDANASGADVIGSSAMVFDLIDLKDLVRNLEGYVKTDAQNLLNMLEEDVVVYERNNLNLDLGGLTVYHPLRAKNLFLKNMEVYRGFDIMPNYVNYIDQFGRMLLDTPAASYGNLSAMFADQGKVQHSVFTLPLNEAQQSNLAGAQLIVLQQSSEAEDAYHLVSVSDAVYMDAEGALNGEFVFRNLFLTDSDGNPVEGTAPLYYKLDSEGRILIPVTLVVSEQESAETKEVQAYLVCMEENAILSVVQILTYDPLSQYYSDRSQIDLSTLQSIRFDCVDRSLTRNEDGTVCGFEDWTVAGVTGYTWNAEEYGELRFLEDILDENTLFAAFSLDDLQGNHYTSELTRFAGEVSAGAVQFTYDDKDQLIQVDGLTCVPGSDNESILLTVKLTNICDQEILVQLSDLVIAGREFTDEVYGYGTGPNFGILPEESQPMFMPVNMKVPPNAGQLDTMSFVLNVYEAETEELLGSVPVTAMINITL